MKTKPNLIGMGENRDEGEFLDLLITTGGRRRPAPLSLRDAGRSPKDALASLNANLLTEEARREALRRFQDAARIKRPTFDVITRPGWAGNAFVFPDETIIPGEANLAVWLHRDHLPYGLKFKSKGTLRAWQRIPNLARGNSRMMLAIAVAFAGPVADLLKVETPMVQIFGAAGSGKTAIAAAAGSVWGGDDDNPFVESWNHTTLDLERVVAAHHATFLILDETKLSDQPKSRPNEFFLAVMHLAEGRTKGRLTATAASFRSRTPVLSTSNKSLDEMAIELHLDPPDDAVRGRLIDIPLLQSGTGAFENLHGYRDHHALAGEMINLARSFHGVAADEFIRKLTKWRARNNVEMAAFLTRQVERYRRAAAERLLSPGRDLGRFHNKIATIFGAASLAIRFGILPWTENELGSALLACEEAHVAYVRSAPAAVAKSAQEADPLERLKAHLRLEARRFVDLRRGLVDPKSNHDHASCAGYINQRPNGPLEYLLSGVMFTEICGGKAAALRPKEDLTRSGALLPDGRRPSTRRMIWASRENGREQVIALRADFFQQQARHAA